MVYTQLCLYFNDLIILVLLFTEANETDGGGGSHYLCPCTVCILFFHMAWASFASQRVRPFLAWQCHIWWAIAYLGIAREYVCSKSLLPRLNRHVLQLDVYYVSQILLCSLGPQAVDN